MIGRLINFGSDLVRIAAPQIPMLA